MYVEFKWAVKIGIHGAEEVKGNIIYRVRGAEL